jgi:hypothetical protein
MDQEQQPNAIFFETARAENSARRLTITGAAWSYDWAA